MSTVLVVQPDDVQADVLRSIFARRVGAELVMVYSTAEALGEIAARIPDLILLSTLLSPRDEDALIAHLRSLDGASHLQTITIPQFRTSTAKAPEKKGGLFRKKSKAPVPVGCDPMAFAEDLVARLKEASEIRNRPMTHKPVVDAAVPAAASIEEMAAASAAAFDTTPFQTRTQPEPAHENPRILDEPAPAEPPRVEAVTDVDEPVPFAPPRTAPQSSEMDEIDRIARELGLDLKYVDTAPTPEAPPPAAAREEDEFDFGAALDRARNAAVNRRPVEAAGSGVDAEAIREEALAEARAQAEREAREKVAADLARVQAEAAAAREAAIEKARAQAEREARERAAADLARVQAEAEAAREAAIEEARALAEREAREAVAADLARVQAEAEAMREAAIEEARAAEAQREAAVAEAREAAERAARQKLDAELARMRAETEVTVAEALNKVRLETEEAERLRVEEARLRAEEAERLRAEEARLRAEEAERVRAEAEEARAEAERMRLEAQEAQEAFAAELARVRSEVEQSLSSQLDAARSEAERMRAAEAATARERVAVEAQLKSDLERLKFVATQTRKADASEVRKATDQIKQLEAELSRVHAQSEERQAAQLEEMRAQMAEMREAAAQQARAAAAEAVASEVARAAAHAHDSTPRKLNVVRMPARVAAPVKPAKPIERAVEEFAEGLKNEHPPSPSSDYYSLFQEAPAAEKSETEEFAFPGMGIDYKRHAKWALPVAACLLVVTYGTGTAVSTVTSFVTPGDDKKQSLVVERVNPDPFIEVIEERVGSLKVESTPEGAEAIVDGKSYGKTPLTIPDLPVGAHTLVLKSSAGSISRRVTIKNNQTTLLSEAIFSGWLAIFSPIPITVTLDGKPVSLTDDGRLMTTPGKHVVEVISDRFNYRASETLDVKPGETTAHTVSLPSGTVRVTAPEGVEIKVDGAPAVGTPAEGFSVPIGSHEISATHPSLGERRASVDVRHGVPTEVTLQFEQ